MVQLQVLRTVNDQLVVVVVLLHYLQSLQCQLNVRGPFNSLELYCGDIIQTLDQTKQN